MELKGRRRKVHLACEALRDCGILVTVFTCLDALFSGGPVALSTVLAMTAGGLALLTLGIVLDPEARG